jgi:hypothetical protein
MNLFRDWLELTEAEKTQIYLTLVMVLVAVLTILGFLTVSRGEDVVYLKERFGLMEARVNYMDQKIDRAAQTQHDHKEQLKELRRIDEQYQRQLEEQQRWIEHWKNLPQLPKPPAKR